MCVSRAGWDGALAGPSRYGEQFAPHCPGERSVKLSIGETSSISLWLLAINSLPRLFQAISHRKLVLDELVIERSLRWEVSMVLVEHCGSPTKRSSSVSRKPSRLRG